MRGYSHDPLLSFVPLVAKERGLAEMMAMKLASVAISQRGSTLVFEVEDLAHAKRRCLTDRGSSRDFGGGGRMSYAEAR